MKKFISITAGIASCVLLCNIQAIAQGVVVSSDMQDVRYVGKTYNGIKGSPYLLPDWANGKVKLTDGTVYEGLKLQYDQLKDELIFSLEDNRPKAFMYPVKEFTIKDESNKVVLNEKMFRSGFTPIDGSTDKSFYEILQDGNTALVKRTSKKIVEERAPGDTYKTKQISSSEKYYLASGNNLIKIKKDKKSFLEALPDPKKASQVDKFIADKKLNLKNENALSQAIAYYNSL
ncbi:hypothetical protein [Sabulibacter ruber]|uniref:hypothetical protein n=1 Tax=Sabulibacter ruber TaxID=2811901 RepID=UPI001A95E57E|nr:hypothetical protein [Sabulibacter ruber]